MNTILKGPSIVALGVLASACAGNRMTPQERAERDAQQTRLEVTSHHWDDVRVYAAGSGARVRLGLVASMETRTFRLPADVLAAEGSVRLIAKPIGAPFPHETDHILLRPGDLVEWRIENPLSLSSYAVRDGEGR